MSYIKKTIYWSKTPGNIVNKFSGKASAFKSKDIDFTTDEWNQTFAVLVLNEIKFDHAEKTAYVYINKGKAFSRAKVLLQTINTIDCLGRDGKIKYSTSELVEDTEEENVVFVSLDDEEYIKFVVLD